MRFCGEEVAMIRKKLYEKDFVSASEPKETGVTRPAVMVDEKQERELLRNGGWRCTKCSRVNQSYTGTCACGRARDNN